MTFYDNNIYLFGLILISLVVGACEAQLTEKDDRQHVILISIDGLAAYHLENEELELPNLRELIEHGVWAEGALSTFPSVTWPGHATLLTGVSPRKHGILANRMTNRETGESFHNRTLTRQAVIHVRTLFDAAKDAGLKTASFNWVSTLQDTTIDNNLLHYHDELDRNEMDEQLLEELRQAGVPIDVFYDWAPLGVMMRGVRDIVMAKAATEVIHTHKPEFIALRFHVTDTKQHRWGPDHYMAHSALTRADYTVGLVRRAVQDAGLEDRTTFVIAADHGFHSVYHEVNIHPVLQASGLADRIRLHGSGWSVFVETTDEFDRQREGPALESFFEELLGLEGPERIVRPEEFHELGYPRYEEDPHVSGQYIIIPDIDTFLVVDDTLESTQRRERSQPAHTHGYLPDHPRMHSALILSGYGIREGARIGMVRNHDVAPTIAELLGLHLPDVEGRVLEEALIN